MSISWRLKNGDPGFRRCKAFPGRLFIPSQYSQWFAALFALAPGRGLCFLPAADYQRPYTLRIWPILKLTLPL